jgi:hypothetical protein
VIGVRHEKQIHLTIGCAFAGHFVSSLEDYEGMKATTTKHRALSRTGCYGALGQGRGTYYFCKMFKQATLKPF